MTNIQFSHANGFPSKSYLCVFKYITDSSINYVNTFGLDPKYKVTNNWQPMVDELIDSIEKFSTEPVVAIGHSLGGILTLFAAQKRPELFKALIFMDPPFFRFIKRKLLYYSDRTNLIDKLPVPSVKTKIRKSNFSSKEFAIDYFASKKLFKDFERACIQSYVNEGLIQHEDHYSLKIPRELEYLIFRKIPHRYGNTKLKMPSFFIYADKQDVIEEADLKVLKKKFKNTTFIPFAGSHMFPFEQPKETGKLINKIISEL